VRLQYYPHLGSLIPSHKNKIMPGLKARFWCFTLNNYDEAELDSLRKGVQTEHVRYAVFGKETGKEGTPHLQGYVAFKKQTNLKRVKEVVGVRAHAEVCKGSEEDNYNYCTKDGLFEEFGDRKRKAGKRSDIRELQAAVLAGEYSTKRLRLDYPDVCAKYPRFVNEFIRDCIPDPDIESHPLNDWQAALNDTLKKPANDRDIIFVVDRKGKRGKSWFAKYYVSLHSDAIILRPTKHADMAYALPHVLRVLFLDCTRKQVEYMPYNFMEECKDGYVFSNKYESCVKKYPPMHVVVLMNQMPDMDALSEDRYDIKVI